MMRQWILLILFLFPALAVAQIRLDKLEIYSKDEYKIIGSDILVVDTLIMRDSSRIILNKEVKENIINAKVVIVGHGCWIIGKGENGANGKAGTNGKRQSAPCTNGGDAQSGLVGVMGGNGLNLSFYVGLLKINGSLTFDLSGGDGGKGGKGGKGGDGGSGTRVCKGGNGGIGGNGGNGNDGGQGGILRLNCKSCDNFHQLEGSKLHVRNYGGHPGYGGIGGIGGQAGLGPLQDGKNGKRGLVGFDGKMGIVGSTYLEQK